VQGWVWYSPGVAAWLARFDAAVLGGRRCDVVDVGAGRVFGLH
jgi:hypothetical protein